MLGQRVLTAALLLPAFVAALFLLPTPAWSLLTLTVVVLALLEWARLADVRSPILFAAAPSIVAVLLVLQPSAAVTTALLALAAAFWLLVAPWLMRRPGAPAPGALLACCGWITLLAAWTGLTVLHAHPGRLLALVAVVWIADSAAYFTGRRFGRRRLAPGISPGKTWEGVAGAAAAVAVYFVTLWIIVSPPWLAPSPLIDGALITLLVVLSIEGDLFESWLKRRAGVKDSGTLLPGHGGVLDRIDGMIAVLPFAALANVGRGLG